MFPETEKILKDFYEPYNLHLSHFFLKIVTVCGRRRRILRRRIVRGGRNGQEIYLEHEREEENTNLDEDGTPFNVPIS
jgi:hypothetical protein